jgi:hypothetical protein
MSYVLAGLITVWICGLLFLAGVLLNDLRMIYNNLFPGAQSRIGEPWRPSEWRWWHAIVFLPLNAADIVMMPAMFLIGRASGLDRVSPLITGVNPALLNDIGVIQWKKAIRHELITVAWAIAGITFIAWSF